MIGTRERATYFKNAGWVSDDELERARKKKIKLS